MNASVALATCLLLVAVSLVTAWDVVIDRANRRGGIATAAVVGVLACVVGGLLLGLACVAPAFMAGCIRSAARRRASATRLDRETRRQLPQALALLASVLDGGAPSAVAIAAIARRLDEPIASALRSVDGSQHGRWPSTTPSLRPLVALLRASDELGTPLAAEVRRLAEDTREAIVRDTRLRAATAGPKMMLVIGCLLAPASLLLIVGSEVLSVIGSLRGIS